MGINSRNIVDIQKGAEMGYSGRTIGMRRLITVEFVRQLCLVQFMMATLMAGCATSPYKSIPTPTQQPESVQLNDSPAAAAQNPAGQLSSLLLYQLLAGEIAGQKGDFVQAVEFYLQAALASDDPQVARRATRVALFAKDQPAALAASQRWLALEPENTQARQTLAVLLSGEGKVTEAVAHFRFLFAQEDIDVAQEFNSVAKLFIKSQDKEVSMAILRELVDAYPQVPQAHFSYAQLAASAGEPETALLAVERAMELQSEWIEAQAFHAALLIQVDKTQQGLAALSEIVERAPDNVNLRLSYARALLRTDHLAKAQAQFQRVLQDEPDNGDALYALGLTAMEDKQYAQANAHFLQLYNSGAYKDPAAYYLGRLAEHDKDYAVAQRWYNTVRRGTMVWDSQLGIARSLAGQGELEHAMQLLQLLREKNPALAERSYAEEGEILYQAGRYQESYEIYTQALQQMPEASDLRYGRALAAERLDMLDVAEQDLRQILLTSPNSAHVLNALGYTLADRTSRFEEALNFIEQAYTLLPDDPAVIDSMGWVRYRMGKIDDAAQYLRRAYELSQDAEIAIHLSEVLRALGLHDEAQKILQEASQAFPNNQELIEVLRQQSKN